MGVMDHAALPATSLETTGTPGVAGTPSRVCLITLAGGLFAIDLQHVREVFNVESVTSVPGMPSVLTGITNLRGIILPVLDARLMLGLSTAGPSPKVAVVIHHRGRQVAVLIDQAPEIRTVQPDQFLPAPQDEARQRGPFVSRILRVEDRLGGVLEVPVLLAHMDEEGAVRSVA